MMPLDPSLVQPWLHCLLILHSHILPLFSHGVSSAMLPAHPMGYRLADDRELASPPTYPESYRSVRYTQDPPRVTQRRWGGLFPFYAFFPLTSNFPLPY